MSGPVPEYFRHPKISSLFVSFRSYARRCRAPDLLLSIVLTQYVKYSRPYGSFGRPHHNLTSVWFLWCVLICSRLSRHSAGQCIGVLDCLNHVQICCCLLCWRNTSNILVSTDWSFSRPHHYHLNPKRSAEQAPNIPNEPDPLHRDIDFYALIKLFMLDKATRPKNFEELNPIDRDLTMFTITNLNMIQTI